MNFEHASPTTACTGAAEGHRTGDGTKHSRSLRSKQQSQQSSAWATQQYRADPTPDHPRATPPKVGRMRNGGKGPIRQAQAHSAWACLRAIRGEDRAVLRKEAMTGRRNRPIRIYVFLHLQAHPRPCWAWKCRKTEEISGSRFVWTGSPSIYSTRINIDIL